MSPSKILLVEDDAALRLAYLRILQRAGHEVREAESGEAAMRMAREECPDLIILDVALPDVNGLELCQRVKKDPDLPGVFVLNISGNHISVEDQAKALEMGSDGYLTKPVPENLLLAHVHALLRIRNSESSLREANRRLLDFNRLKSEFVANMSHELRTPLTSIIGFAQLSLRRADKEPLAPSHADNLERILRNGRHLLALIDDVLDISKIEAGRMILHSEPFDLVELVQSTFAEMRSLAEEAGIEYRLVISDTFPMLFTDPLRVRQIVINLLSNALKFTEKGLVVAELSMHGLGHFQFRVTDTGVGIEKQQLGWIFDRFRQVDGSSTRAQGGTGLGLAIVKQVCELLGGTVEASSEAGHGSVFVATLPLVAPDAEYLSSLPWSAIPRETTRPPVRPAAVDKRPLVLIIEDDPDTGLLLSSTLERNGYRVELAPNGIRGMTLARELLPSAITLDIMMPSVDGWRVLQALRADPRTCGIPIIVVSIIDNRPLGYRLGASDYLIKPVEPKRLLESLTQVGASATDGEGGYVLVVDDEHGVRELLVVALRQAGYEARSAASGEVALALATDRPPKAVLSDLMMPGGMSGFELIARLRSEPRTESVPVIVITGKDISPDDRRTLTGQIADVIRKGDLMLPDLQTRLRDALEEFGITP